MPWDLSSRTAAALAAALASLAAAPLPASAAGVSGVASPEPPPPKRARPGAPVTLQSALDAYARDDLRQAERQFRELSRQGVPLGDYNLAMMHLRDEVATPDPRLALALLTRAAGRGLVRAELALGEFHEQGAGGQRDLVQAHRWYLKAAEHGSADAQVAVATAFYLGRGVEKDMTMAALWYRQAARSGDVGAQYLIASMYETGLGVDRDLPQARQWYDAAARNGDIAAAAKVKALEAQIAADAGAV